MDDLSETAPQEKTPASWKLRAGIWMMAGSLPIWPILMAVPLLSLTAAKKTIIAGVLVAFAETLFWGGAILAGPEAVRRFKSKFRVRRGPRIDDSPLP